jgi:type I restriction enzyme M protein
VNASAHFVKEKPKNALTDEGIAAVSDVFQRWETREKLSRVVTLEQVREADYNLSPSLVVETNDKIRHRSLAQIIADLSSANAEREHADEHLSELLVRLGI